MQDLGTLGGEVRNTGPGGLTTGINDRGQVVGSACMAAGSARHIGGRRRAACRIWAPSADRTAAPGGSTREARSPETPTRRTAEAVPSSGPVTPEQDITTVRGN